MCECASVCWPKFIASNGVHKLQKGKRARVQIDFDVYAIQTQYYYFD